MTAAVSDGDLLARYRAGDDSALEAIFERYETPVFQFLLGILRDHHRAEDTLQETFVRALERLDGVDPAHWRGWLFTVAYHQAMLAKRRLKSRARTGSPGAGSDMIDSLPDHGRGPWLEAELRDDAQRLHALLAELPAAQRDVILQRIYEGKRFRDIADTLHCPVNTALARMHDGLKKLRSMWEEGHGRQKTQEPDAASTVVRGRRSARRRRGRFRDTSGS
jgi:RNA polymerase sigma-70 factor (ECF subfamily)